MDLCLDSMISILKDNRYGLSFRDIKSNFDNEDKEIKTVIESGELFNLIKRLGEGRSTRYYDFNVDAILPNSNTANKEIQKFSDLTGKKKIEEILKSETLLPHPIEVIFDEEAVFDKTEVSHELPNFLTQTYKHTAVGLIAKEGKNQIYYKKVSYGKKEVKIAYDVDDKQFKMVFTDTSYPQKSYEKKFPSIKNLASYLSKVVQ